MFITLSRTPAAIAAVAPERLMDAAEVVENEVQHKCNGNGFSNFFENAFINRVKRLMLILMANDNLLSDYYDMSAKPVVQGMRLRVVR
jgi:hypothetical protein